MVAVGLTLAACEVLTDLGGLTGGVAPDGGEGGVDAMPVMGTTDAKGDQAAEANAEAAVDARVEAGTDAPFDAAKDSGTVSFCMGQPTTHYLCADFDEGALTAGWTGMDLAGAGAVALDTLAWKSPPASLASTVPTASGTTNSARLAMDLPSTPFTTVHLEFDVDLKLALSTPADGEDEPFAIHQVTTDNAYYGVVFRVNSLGAYVTYTARTDAGGPGTTLSSLALPSGWFHVTLDEVVAPGPTGSITVKFNNQTAIQVSGIVTLTASYARSYIDFGMYDLQGKAGSANFDNVIIDVN